MAIVYHKIKSGPSKSGLNTRIVVLSSGFIRSSLGNDLIKSVVMSVRLLTFLVFQSPLLRGRQFLTLHRMILDIGPHNRSVSDFAISGHVIQK